MTRTEEAWDELERAWSVYEDSPDPEDGSANYLGMIRCSLRRMFQMRIPIEAIDLITIAVNSAYAYANKDAPEVMLLFKHSSIIQEVLRDAAYKKQSILYEWIDGALESRGLPSIYEIRQITHDFETMSLSEWIEEKTKEGKISESDNSLIQEKVAKTDKVWDDFLEFKASLERLKSIINLEQGQCDS